MSPHTNAATALELLPRREMVETVDLPAGTPPTALVIRQTGQSVLVSEDVPRLMRPDYMRVREQPGAATAALKWAARFLNFPADEFARLDWGALCRYDVMHEFKACFVTATEKGYLTRQVASQYFVQLRMVALEAWKLERITRDEYERIKSIPAIKYPSGKRLRSMITPEDYDRALALCDIDGTKAYCREAHTDVRGSRIRGVMCAAMIAILRWGGTRSVEVRRLDFKDVYWDRLELYLVGKEQRDRTIAVSPECMARLRAWREIRGDAEGPLFYSFRRGGGGATGFEMDKKGNPQRVSYSTMDSMCQRISKALNIPAFKTHAFRRALITHFLDAGYSAPVIQAHSGHVNADMIQTYDQHPIERWHGIWDDSEAVADFAGRSGPAADLRRYCPICHRDLDNLVDENGKPEKPMKDGAGVCRREKCRQAAHRRKQAVILVTHP